MSKSRYNPRRVVSKRVYIIGFRKIVARHFELNSYTFSMEQRIDQAIKMGYLCQTDAKWLSRRLDDILKNKEFLSDWNRLKRKWARTYYPAKSKKIYFGIEFCDPFVIGRPDVNTDVAFKYSYIREKSWDDIRAFLGKYRIDAVINGKPLVDIYKYRVSQISDNASREIFHLEIPLVFQVREARKIFEKEYGGFRKDYVLGSSEENWPFDYDIPRKQWGERTGKMKYYRERDEKIIREYKEMKKTGLSDDDIYFRIYDKLKLENDMTEYDSIKPIIDAFKKGNRNK